MGSNDSVRIVLKGYRMVYSTKQAFFFSLTQIKGGMNASVSFSSVVVDVVLNVCLSLHEVSHQSCIFLFRMLKLLIMDAETRFFFSFLLSVH